MVLDHPQITRRLFYPRRENEEVVQEHIRPVLIPVDENVSIGGFLHRGHPGGAQIVFFHGNGEIAADYHDLAPYFVERGINFLVFDYRGYGRSGGSPSVSTMLKDAHKIFAWVKAWRKENPSPGPLIVMGRSLGSASALELAHHYPTEIHGLIVESGFARTGPLLTLLGVNLNEIGFREELGLRHQEKIASFTRPTLIIHAQFDSLILLEEGKLLYELSRATEKRLTVVPNADHNTIFAWGMDLYFESVNWLVDKAYSYVV
ncbi:MAG: lysophospholipase [Syntrophales bacterium]|nr:lysophospholipase [Syntrophales bacterium]